MHESVIRLLNAAREATRESKAPIENFVDLGVRLGLTSARITNWKTRGVSRDGAIAAGREFGCSADYILTGQQPANRRRQPADTGAQTGDITVPQKPMSWRELMELEVLPPVFELTLRDDAMKPEFPAGMVIRFTSVASGAVPEVGNRVLVRDGKGGYYFRTYAETHLDEWEGRPSDTAFRSIFPARDKATVVAVKAGHYVPGP